MKATSDSANDTKTIILGEAYELFDKQGYHVTPISDISSKTGLTKAALYYHFKSKKDLMLGVLNMVLEELQNNLYSIAYDSSAGEPKERLEKFFAWQEASYNDGPRSCFIGTMALEIASHDLEFSAILDTIFNEWEDALTHLYGHFHDIEKGRRYAQQTIMEFEGAVMLGLVRKNKSIAIKQAISHAMDRIHT